MTVHPISVRLGIIDQIRWTNETQPKKQRHTAQWIWDRLKVEHTFRGGYTVVKDYVRQARLQQKKCSCRWRIRQETRKTPKPLPSDFERDREKLLPLPQAPLESAQQRSTHQFAGSGAVWGFRRS